MVYVIFMVCEVLDVLVVYLLFKEVGCKYMIFVVLLFEILDDLDYSEKVMIDLFNIGWYCGIINNY